MSSLGSAVKDSDATLDFQIDWSEWLASGETISDATWSVPAGLTNENEVDTDTTSTVWLSGGTAGTWYTVTNRVTTTDGRVDERSIIIRVTER